MKGNDDFFNMFQQKKMIDEAKKQQSQEGPLDSGGKSMGEAQMRQFQDLSKIRAEKEEKHSGVVFTNCRENAPKGKWGNAWRSKTDPDDHRGGAAFI